VSITISHPTGEPEGETWTTQEMQRDFDVIGFSSPYVAVIRRKDGAKGSLQFTGGGGTPRMYFNFIRTDI